MRLLNKQGVTVILTTHYLEEAESLCDYIAIIHQGKLIANEEKETLLARIDNKEVRFRLDREIGEMPRALQKFNPQQEGKRTLMVRYSPAEQTIGEILSALQQSGYGIVDISTEESDLEDIFLQMTRS